MLHYSHILKYHIQRLVTGWAVLGSNPRGGEIFRIPDRPWGPLSLLYNGYRVFPRGVKRPLRGVDHPPPSSVEVEGRVELYICSPSGSSWTGIGGPLPLPLSITLCRTSLFQYAGYLSVSSSVPVMYFQWFVLPFLSKSISYIFRHNS